MIILVIALSEHDNKALPQEQRKGGQKRILMGVAREINPADSSSLVLSCVIIYWLNADMLCYGVSIPCPDYTLYDLVCLLN